MKKVILLSVLLITAITVFGQKKDLKLNANNIDEVINAMTLEEKASLLVGDAWGTRNQTSDTDGSSYVSGPIYVPGAPFSTRPITRFGIPGTGMSDGTAGIRFNISRAGTDKLYYATSFPSSTTLASTWNTELVNKFADAIGNEVKEYGVDVVLGPGMDLQRNQLCGRNFEYFSEDPLLTGKMTAAWVNGVQRNGVGVSAKHFAGNDQETNRFYVDARMNTRTLREMTLKGFEIMVKEAQPWTIMSSYNMINGVFTQQNYDLLSTILRDEWGYRGIVITDWGYKDGTVKAVKAGNDVMEAGMSFEIDRIIAAVKDGSLPIADVDRNVKRILQYIVKTPRFKGYKYSDNPDLKAHSELVRKSSAEAMVLLKNNDRTLPLKGIKNVALFGLTSYNMIAGGTGSGNVNKKYVRNLKEGFEDDGIVVDSSVCDWYTKYHDFQKVNINPSSSSSVMLGDALIPDTNVPDALVKKSEQNNDAVIITIGRNAGEGGDRMLKDGDWTITAEERALLQNVADTYHAVGKKVIVVLNIGGAIETASWKSIPDAILLAWTPGQEVGYTVADVLTGKSYPSGKLPMTFPVNYFDTPSSHNFPYAYSGLNFFDNNAKLSDKNRQPEKNVDFVNYEEGIWVGYRYFTTAKKEVSYPFGFGLGYTSFEYSAPEVKVTKDGTLTASVTVKNTGNHIGKEAVEIYVKAPAGGLVKPDRELKSFGKTKELDPGKSQRLTFTIDPYTLASYNENASAWQTASGDYHIYFAASSEDLKVSVVVAEPKSFSWSTHNVLLPAKKINEIKVK
jgi:beta-glucosidase